LLSELDESDERLASVRVPNVGAIAAAAKKAERKAAPKPTAPAEKPAAEKPRPRGGPRKHAAASPENHETVST
jgi:hypothetical protein